jgi:transcriptional regulator with GAF, ATPase, and Fis domain
VLLTGESGTGKEVVARAIHGLSPLASGPFVAVDCGALPEHLLESHLFGHEKGAFTGADRPRPACSRWPTAARCFSTSSATCRSACRRSCCARSRNAPSCRRGQRAVPFHARLLCATNSDLGNEVRAGRFRVDLYHRIAEFVVLLPPLRERPEDIVHFARLFLAEANLEMGRNVRGFTPAGEQALRQCPWPGNLRELRNAVRRMVLVGSSLELDACDLRLGPNAVPESVLVAEADSAVSLAERVRLATDALEAQILSSTLRGLRRQQGGCRTLAAHRLHDPAPEAEAARHLGLSPVAAMLPRPGHGTAAMALAPEPCSGASGGPRAAPMPRVPRPGW